MHEKESNKIVHHEEPHIEPIYFKMPLKMLLYLGLDIIPIEDEFKRFRYRIYSYLSIGILLLYTVLEFLDNVINFEGIEKATFAMCYFVTHILGTAKVFLMLFQKKSLWSTFQKIEQGIFKPDLNRGGIIEYKLVKRAIKFCHIHIQLFYTFVILIIFQHFLYSMLDSGTDKEIHNHSTNTTTIIHVRSTPYSTWIPYFDVNKSPTYEILCACQVYITVVYGLHIGAVDTLIFGFMLFIKAQFLILKISLDTLIERSEQAALAKYRNIDKTNNNDNNDVKSVTLANGIEKVELLSNEVQKQAEFLAKNIVSHHQQLLNLCDEAEETFCYLMLIQFISSLLLLCFQLFQISTMSVTSFDFFSMCCYLFLMVFQLFCYCWNGNEVQILSGELAIDAYKINWIVTNKNIKKYLLLMMMRSQRCFCFTAGKFSILSLTTFMTIVRGAVSYFMVLKQMNNS